VEGDDQIINSLLITKSTAGVVRQGRTPTFTAYLRALPVNNMEGAYQIDVISNQWIGKAPPECSEIWQVFPESATPPAWLDTPTLAEELHNEGSLYYLAAALIRSGSVDASSCADGGLTNFNTANECGMSMAASKMTGWQNQYNQTIHVAAKADGIPAALLKNIFLKESQLWPGIYDDIHEVGLGQLTENGADTALLWNPEFYNSFCPLVLDRSICTVGYSKLGEERQALLRGALLQKTNAACPTCADGIDTAKASYSVHVFAESLKANCSQVNQLVLNATRKPPRNVIAYSDLWRFTLVNYNAGSGCLENALARTWNAKAALDWVHVAANLAPVCRNAVDYVIDITDGDTPAIKQFSTPLPSATPTKQLTPSRTPTRTQTGTQTPGKTITPSVTPTPH